jgi:hypothetical protein
MWIGGWVSVGVGVAALATGAGMHVWASQISDEVGDIDPYQTQEQIRKEHDDINDRVNARQYSAFGLYGVGGAAAAAGVVLLVLSTRSGDKDGGSETVTVSPVPLRGGAGGQVVVTF